MTDVAATKTPTLGALYRRTILASVIHAPVALALAAASICLLLTVSRLDGWEYFEWIIAPVLAHGLFIALMCGFIAPARTIRARAVAVGWSALRGTVPMALIFAFAMATLFVFKPGVMMLWAAATYFALPARFGRNWNRLLEPTPTPPLQRLAVMAPSFLFLSAMTWLLANAGGSWGMMDGGAVTFPLLGLTLFWACFSCALFSAHFAAEQD